MTNAVSTVLVAAVLLVAGCGKAEGQPEGAPAGPPQAKAEAPAPGRGAASVALGGAKVSVDYGRPELQGRDLMALLPVGQEWRMGSNAATTLTTDAPLKFGETTVPAGTYVLKAKRAEADAWRLLIQSSDGATVAEVPMTYQKGDGSVDPFTIDLTGREGAGQLVLKWGQHVLSAPFTKA
jgi:hypothetical protein